MGVDVLIITALPEEFDAVEAVDRGAAGDWIEHKDSSGFRYQVRDYEAEAGGQLQVALAQAVKMGGEATMEAASRLVPELRPRCLAMCGICAGWRLRLAERQMKAASLKLSVGHVEAHRTTFGDLQSLVDVGPGAQVVVTEASESRAGHEAARKHLETAQAIVEETGYGRRAVDVNYLEKRLPALTK